MFLPREERLVLIDWANKELPISTQADLLSIPRSSLYYKPVAPFEEEIRLKNRIDEIYTAHPYYGSRRITAVLKREGFEVNRKAVQRHMREMGIAGISPGPNLSKSRLRQYIYPYLLKGIEINRPNQVWGIDITYIRMSKGWTYLVAVLDWHSRYVVSWELSESLEVDFVLTAVRNAFKLAVPEIMNSDQGSQFTSPQYIEMLKEAGAKISMDGRGRALDNIFTERLWRTIKYEEVYIHEYQSPREARRRLKEYLRFYNEARPHQALEYRTPAEVHFE